MLFSNEFTIQYDTIQQFVPSYQCTLSIENQTKFYPLLQLDLDGKA